jgi:hypothetical protein
MFPHATHDRVRVRDVDGAHARDAARQRAITREPAALSGL